MNTIRYILENISELIRYISEELKWSWFYYTNPRYHMNKGNSEFESFYKDIYNNCKFSLIINKDDIDRNYIRVTNKLGYDVLLWVRNHPFESFQFWFGELKISPPPRMKWMLWNKMEREVGVEICEIFKVPMNSIKADQIIRNYQKLELEDE